MKGQIVDSLARQVQFTAIDGWRLPGLLFEPAAKTQRVLIVLHGCGSTDIFYSPQRNRAFANSLNRRGIAYFAFNNRGAHIMKTLKRLNSAGEEERQLFGTAYERIKESVSDINGAVAFLEKLGYKQLYLYGHSTGANKICVYDHYQKKNPFQRYILAGGGDDTGLMLQQAGSVSQLNGNLQKARQMITRGQSKELVPREWATGFLSYDSYLDVADPDGDYNCFPFFQYQNKLLLSKKPLFHYFSQINKPSLVIYGQADEYALGSGQLAVEILRRHQLPQAQIDYRVIANTDHGFSESEQHLAEQVANWI